MYFHIDQFVNGAYAMCNPAFYLRDNEGGKHQNVCSSLQKPYDLPMLSNSLRYRCAFRMKERNHIRCLYRMANVITLGEVATEFLERP